MTNGVPGAVPVMVIAVVLSTVIMVVAINPVSDFVERHPSVKMLALAFLLLIGTNLIAEAAHIHVPKGYVYFAMAFSVLVEMLNIKTSGRRSEPVKLHPPT
jgi:predicted tellurium resistance membrane protein TerC